MLVDLTAAQADAVVTALSACGFGWAAQRWSPLWTLREWRVTVMECLMPAIGWQQTLTALVEVSVGPRGGNRKDAATCALNARQRIAHALSTYAAHPALYGVGMLDVHDDVIPAWRLASPRREGQRYSIFPGTQDEFVHLIPTNDGRFTRWEAIPARWTQSGPTVLDPDEHWRFLLTDRESAPDDSGDPG
jgi:hypothetical protein